MSDTTRTATPMQTAVLSRLAVSEQFAQSNSIALPEFEFPSFKPVNYRTRANIPEVFFRPTGAFRRRQ